MRVPRPWHGSYRDSLVRQLAPAALAECMRVARLSKLPLIAIVDDDGAMRDALGDLLQVAGFDGRTYASAGAFLADYEPGRFAMLITDVRMPKMDGFELLRQLRLTSAAPPALVITACPDESTRARAMKNGAIDCLTKPVADDILLGIVDRALGGRWGQSRGG